MTNLSGANLNNGAAVGPQGEGRDSPSTFPAYPIYKDSGVEWLGEVPEHWTVQPLKRAIAKIESGTSVNAADYPAEPGSYGVLKTSCVYTGQFEWRENKTVDDEDLNRVSCPLQINTLVVSRMNTPDLVGATGLVTEAPTGIFLPDRLWQVYFEKDQSASFVFYFTKAPEYREQVKNACSGTSSSMQNLGQDDFRTLLFVEPPVAEQAQIARFLDHETARIDALIEEQQRLIALLKEKRQAVISHAVTKGLDPTVTMKDSGVEWLGEMPAHWSFKPSKYLLEFVTSGSRGWAEYYSDDGDLFFRIANLTRDSIEPKLLSMQYVIPPKNAEGERSKIKCDDILISITADLGSVCVANSEVAGSYVSQHVALARPIKKAVFSRWLAYFVMSDTCKEQLVGAGYGGTKVQLSLDDIRTFWISMPPYEEQVSLAAFLDREIQAFDGLISQAAIGMDLLSERRSALISAAVTGKIDVRGWQPPARVPTSELAQEAV